MTSDDARRTHVFEVSGRWRSDPGSGEVGLSGPQAAAIAVPRAFGGTQAGTNPEELLLASALSCYLMTLARVLAQRGMGALAVDATIVGEVSRTAEGLHFDRIRLRPVVHGAGPHAATRPEIEQALRDAEDACFIARTLRPLIPYALEPRFAD